MLNTNPTTLAIMAINVGSLITLHRRVDIETFTKHNNPDVVLLSETRISAIHKVNIANYIFPRNDKLPNNPGRGTGILLKDCFNHQAIDTATLIGTSTQSFLLVSVYRLHDNLAIDTSDLNKIISNYQNCGATHLVIGGDLNALHELWNINNRNPAGVRLHQWLSLQDTKLRVLKVPNHHNMTATEIDDTIEKFRSAY